MFIVCLRIRADLQQIIMESKHEAEQPFNTAFNCWCGRCHLVSFHNIARPPNILSSIGQRQARDIKAII